MADVNLRRITPVPSDFVDGLDRDKMRTWRDYVSYITPHKYLDLFTAFSLGYYDGSNWNIVDAHNPSWINRYNWVDRHESYRAAEGVLGVASATTNSYGQVSTTLRTRVESDARGPYTSDGYQHTNIPLFWAIDSATTIEKLAVFVSSAIPGWWRYGTDHWGVAFNDWQQPPRDIVKGLQVRWGNCSLSAIKVEK